MARTRKKKKSKQQQKQRSPVAFLRNQARNLPLHESFIDADWQTRKQANVVVVRQHRSGNFTYGKFGVDLACLGVIAASWQYNQPPTAYEQFKTECLAAGMEVCPYPLAHNVVHGAVEFAEEFGFAPHQEFRTATGILEVDDERVELVEIEFGEDGVPHLTIPKGEFCFTEIQQLDKHLGRGNYHLTAESGGLENILFLLEQREKVVPRISRSGIQDPNDWGEERWLDFIHHSDQYTFPTQARAFDMIYSLHKRWGRAVFQTWIDAEPTYYSEGVSWIEIPEHPLYQELTEQDLGKLETLEDIIREGGDYKSELDELLETFSSDPFTLQMLLSLFWGSKNLEETERILHLALDNFPDFLPNRFRMASFLIAQGDPEAGLTFLKGSFDLADHAPGRSEFLTLEVVALLDAAIRYHNAKGEMEQASMYFHWLWGTYPNHPVNWDGIIEFIEQRSKVLYSRQSEDQDFLPDLVHRIVASSATAIN